jgi:hemolysin III
LTALSIYGALANRCETKGVASIKLSIAFYLAMGWSGALAYDKAAASLPSLILALIAAGGGLYTMGVLFHSWERLRFRNAIWHGFVILGAGCHFTAVVGLVTA